MLAEQMPWYFLPLCYSMLAIMTAAWAYDKIFHAAEREDIRRRTRK